MARKDPTYNGHKNKAYWNVALWIANDYGLYQLALESIRSTRNRRAAAERMLDALGEGSKTPDGYAYSVDKIQRAMSGLS